MYEDGPYDSVLLQHMIRFMGISSYDRIEPRKYHITYSKYVPKLRNTPAKFLEIGMHKGNSWFMWAMYLGPPSQVYGVDITDDHINKYKGLIRQFDRGSFKGWKWGDYPEDRLASRLKYKIFNSTDPLQVNNHFPEKIYKDYFNIIIDDGSHEASDQVKTYWNFASRLKPNGVYFIEDINNLFESAEPVWDLLETLSEQGHYVYKIKHKRTYALQDIRKVTDDKREGDDQWMAVIEHREHDQTNTPE